MRISAIHIEGFGVFSEQSASSLPPGLVLFRGDNESGKSTLLEFIRTVLFGYPRRNARDRRFYDALRGGRPGGRLQLVLRDQTQAILDRTTGKSGLTLSIPNRSDQVATEQDMHVLLGGTSEELFANVYAFSLDELQRFESLQKEGIQSALQSVSAGATAQALPEAKRTIDKQRKELFSRGGRTAKTNQKLATFEKVQAELGDVTDRLGSYDELSARLLEAEHERNALVAITREARLRLQRASNDEQLWPTYMDYRNASEALDRLPLVITEFPEAGVARWEAVSHQNAICLENAARAKDERSKVDQGLSAVNVDQALIEKSAEVRQLVADLGRYLATAEELPDVRRDAEDENQAVARSLQSLGPDWSEERVKAIDRSLFVEDTINRHRVALESAERRLDQASQTCTHCQSAVDEARAKEQIAKARLDDLPCPDNPLDEQVVKALSEGKAHAAAVAREATSIADELGKTQQALAQAITDIHPSWSRREVDALDTSASARQRVATSEASLESASAAVATAQHTLAAARGRRDEAKADFEAAQHRAGGAHAPAPRDDLKQRREMLRKLRTSLQQRDRATEEIETLEDLIASAGCRQRGEPRRLGLLKWIAAGLLVLAVLVAAAGLLLGRPVAAAVAAAALGLVGAVLLVASLAARGTANASVPSADPSGPAKTRLRRMREKLDRETKRVAEQAQALSLPRSPCDEDLDEIEAHQEEELERLYSQRHLHEEITRAAERLKRADGRVLAAQQALDGAQAACDEAERSWRKLAQSMSVGDDWGPRVALRAFDQVDAIRDQFRAVSSLERRLRAAVSEWDRYCALGAGIAELEAAQKAPDDFLKAVDALLERWNDQLQAHRERENKALLHQEATAVAATLRERLDEARAAEREASARLEEVGREWNSYLGQQGLPAGLQPETATRALATVNECLAEVARRDSHRGRATELESEVQGYEHRASALFEALGRRAPEAGELPGAIRTLEHELEAAERASTELRELRLRATNATERVRSAETDARRCQAELDDLLRAAEATNEDDFRSRAAAFADRARLVNAQQQSRDTMRRISGEADFAALDARLQQTTLDEIRAARTALEDEVAEHEERAKAAHERVGKLGQELEQMQSSEDAARLRAELERLRTELREHALDWARWTLAGRMLESAQQKFEQEHQPAVITTASRFFHTITDGRYHEIRAPLGQDKIEVVASTGETKSPEQLSRGTSEQLYLALRFGYVQQHARGRDPLPIIMDDILVNFDPNRARQSAAALVGLCSTHQVLFFTCHPETEDLFKRTAPGCRVIRIEDGRLLDGSAASPT